jgi:hypothetical protein
MQKRGMYPFHIFGYLFHEIAPKNVERAVRAFIMNVLVQIPVGVHVGYLYSDKVVLGTHDTIVPTCTCPPTVVTGIVPSPR